MANRQSQTFGDQQMPVLTYHHLSHHHRSHPLNIRHQNSLMVINGETMFRNRVKDLDACRE